MKKVTIYTDGACSVNPGKGGYGAVLIYNNHRKEISGGNAKTTNNQMEVMGAIAALEILKTPCEVELYSDSRYLVDSVEKGWITHWKANGWRRGKKGPAQNVDLWERLLPLLEKHKIKFHWMKGHSGHPENDRCDLLARAAIANM